MPSSSTVAARRARVVRLTGRAVIALVMILGVLGVIEPKLVGTARPLSGLDPVSFLRSLRATEVDHEHGHGANASVDPSQLDPALASALASQLVKARAVAARWPTAQDAVKAGWTLAATYETHQGTHYMHFADIDGVFDVKHPEMLLYDSDRPTAHIVGLAYYVKFTQPTGFSGPFDVWHQHVDVCIGPNGPLVGADAVGVCATTSTRPVGAYAWMLHVWIVPGHGSPQGVFSRVNLALR